MNRIARSPIALAFVLFAGCGVPPEAELAPEETSTRAAEASFTFDTSALTAIPAGTIPDVRLPLGAYDGPMVQRALLGTTESFTQTYSVSNRIEMSSPSFTYSTDMTRGMVLGVNALPPGPCAQGNVCVSDEALLTRAALSKLQSWGVGAGEIGEVWQRRLYGTDEDSGRVTAPALAAYKTFVNRAILGVRVDGHRAVVTHGLDGAFRRVIAKWPALASTGHLLHTRLTTADITGRATTALVNAGYSSGLVRLSWKYVSTENARGEATLSLVAAARLAPGGRGPDEPFEVDVDVSAVQ